MTENTGNLYVVVSQRVGGAVTRDPSKAANSANTMQPADVVVIDIDAGEFDFFSAEDLRHVTAQDIPVEDVLSAAPGEFRRSIE